MKLSTRIGAGLFSLLALMIVIGIYLLWVIAGLRQENRHLAETGLETGTLSLSLRREFSHLHELTEKLEVLQDPEYATELDRRRSHTRQLIERMRQLPLSPAERVEIGRLSALWVSYEETGPWAEARMLGGDPELSLDRELDGFDEMRAVIGRLMVASERALADRAAESARKVERARGVALIAWLSSMLAAIVTSAFVIRSIAVSLGRLQRGAHKLGAGDLSYRVQVEGPGEFSALAADFNSMADRLEELERLKKDFVSMVSHQLKAPLASMQETLNLVLDGSLGPLSGEQKKILNLNQASADRLSEMIHDLLDLACLEAGAMEFDFRKYDIVELARAVLAEFEPSMRVQGLRSATCFPDEPVLVRADVALLRQVLLNLVSNAVRFTPRDGTIEVAVRSWDEAAKMPKELDLDSASMMGPLVVVSVSDSGPGIPDGHKERVFEHFHRIDDRAKGGQGTGLGLAITQGIVDGHHGRIWVEDRPGGGATFMVLLKAAAPGVADRLEETALEPRAPE